VTYPAYEDTEADARSILKMRDEEREISDAEQSKASADIIKLIAIRYKNY
jgi:phage head maturation protease